MSTILLKNIGALLSGRLEQPVLNADAVLIKDGIIQCVDNCEEIKENSVETIIDCHGTTVMPGLIDTHCHPVLGDYTPKQKQTGFLEDMLHGGVTTAISAGEIHLPGRPTDPAGVKAMAILAAKSYANFRPGGIKVEGGAVILENGLVEDDFKEMAREGVRLVGEIGLGSAKTVEEAGPMVRWAKANGMTVMMHTGGTSMPGSSSVTARMVMDMDPDIASHVNGGTTSISIDEIKKLVEDTSYILEIVHCGNPLAAVETMKLALENDCLERLIIGNDSPTGSGVITLGLLRMLNFLSSLTRIRPEQAVCLATGNAARVFGLNRGEIIPGKEADLVIMDAPIGSMGEDALSAIEIGDIPGVSMVIVDGEIKVMKSRNTAPAKRQATII
ncbi:MAG: amidohydrolase family protein [Deltaproteobacteria bacterium]|jgi:enamidase|nr:amidohydrolase family protein [Deltaproteobacteria bacterium]MBT4637874.1 amidohydrolase family protein [Deltaproteobacteria bacterium]